MSGVGKEIIHLIPQRPDTAVIENQDHSFLYKCNNLFKFPEIFSRQFTFCQT